MRRPPRPEKKGRAPLHEMHLAQTLFGELERIAGRNELARVSTVRLRILEADTSCLVECLEMLFQASPLFREARIAVAESGGGPDPSGARVIIERVEGEKD